MALGQTPYRDGLPGFQANSDTSKLAAREASRNLAKSQRRVIFALARLREATADQVCAYLRLGHNNSVAPRLTELGSLGYVEDTERRVRTRAGSNAAVLKLSNKGERLLPQLLNESEGAETKPLGGRLF